ncbi:MAG: sulfotransferase domain-containing protein [Chthoniobacterales bacterium]|nr:sulfotransferase domain-containing protein [Chthoniobacterales bacterium]
MLMKNHRRIIVVLGVRRSGTSAIAKGLESMGVSVVDQAHTSFNSFNKKGYWEDLEIHQFNKKVIVALSSLNKRCRSTLSLSQAETDFLCEKGFLQQGVDLMLAKLLRLQQPLGIKDPRFSILLPFWKRIFKACDVPISFVIALRNPMSAVASMKVFDRASMRMKAFDHFCEEHSECDEKYFWMWIASLLGCLDGSEGEERILVDYNELLKHPTSQIKRIADVLKLEIEEDRLKNYGANFIDPSLCHFTTAEFQKNIDSDCQKFALEIYQQLFAIAKDQASFAKLKHSHEQWKTRLSSAKSLLVLAEKNEKIILFLRAAMLVQKETIDKLNQKIAQNLSSPVNLHQNFLKHARDNF